jgi:hypothetical protein
LIYFSVPRRGKMARSLHLKFTLYILTIIVGACSESNMKFSEGACIGEVNTRYVASTRKTERIYKIEKAEGNRYSVSTFYRNSWQYLGKKSESYFNKNSAFNYKKITCPGEKDTGGGIGDKIKNMTL